MTPLRQGLNHFFTTFRAMGCERVTLARAVPIRHLPKSPPRLRANRSFGRPVCSRVNSLRPRLLF